MKLVVQIKDVPTSQTIEEHGKLVKIQEGIGNLAAKHGFGEPTLIVEYMKAEPPK